MRERGKSRRREHLISKALQAGFSAEFADEIYDIAEEEKVDPAVAFEVVLAGTGVLELTEPAPDNWSETQVDAAPAWLEPDAPGPTDAARERRLRLTFRRLRSLMETESSIDDALHKFHSQPDVGPTHY